MYRTTRVHSLRLTRHSHAIVKLGEAVAIRAHLAAVLPLEVEKLLSRNPPEREYTIAAHSKDAVVDTRHGIGANVWQLHILRLLGDKGHRILHLHLLHVAIVPHSSILLGSILRNARLLSCVVRRVLLLLILARLEQSVEITLHNIVHTIVNLLECIIHLIETL